MRTPESHFDGLFDFPYETSDVIVDGLRMVYVDHGPCNGPIVLLLHGEPAWSYLYRRMIRPFVAAGYRCIAPNLIGFGRSGKPVNTGDYRLISVHGGVRPCLPEFPRIPVRFNSAVRPPTQDHR